MNGRSVKRYARLAAKRGMSGSGFGGGLLGVAYFRARELPALQDFRGRTGRLNPPMMVVPREDAAMLFVIHALDKKGEMATRAKHYRDHRQHLDNAEDYDVDVVTAGTLLADDGEMPCGSVFRDRRRKPRRDRPLRAERSLPYPWRMGARRHPRLQQEARNADHIAAGILTRDRPAPLLSDRNSVILTTNQQKISIDNGRKLT